MEAAKVVLKTLQENEETIQRLRRKIGTLNSQEVRENGNLVVEPTRMNPIESTNRSSQSSQV